VELDSHRGAALGLAPTTCTVELSPMPDVHENKFDRRAIVTALPRPDCRLLLSLTLSHRNASLCHAHRPPRAMGPVNTVTAR